MKSVGKKLSFFLLLLLSAATIRGQYFSLGTDPASTRWEQLRSRHFRIIYPQGMEKRAQYIANGLEHIRLPASRTLGSPKIPKTPLILHTSTTLSNAYVPYAPRRSEFISTPPQDMYAQDWIDDIIIHESRHLVHFAAVNRGFTKGLSYILGQQAPPAILGLFIPPWFIEGDATVQETAMSHTGRGRVPSFHMRLKAQLLEKGIYSYDKATHGSYRHFTPNWYELGYHLVGLGRVHFGTDLWNRAVDRSGRLPLMLVPFSSALKQKTGMGKRQLYSSLLNELGNEWIEADKDNPVTSFELIVNHPARDYTSYRYPVTYRDSLVIAECSSYDDITRIVMVGPGKKECVLFTPGVGYVSESLSIGGDLICWQEVDPDPRWSLRDYMVVKTFNLRSGKIRQLTRHSRYFSPVISPDGTMIAAVNVTERNHYYLVILDAASGGLIRLFDTPDNLFLIHPSWSEDGSAIACVVLGNEGKSIALFDAASGSFDLILPFGFNEIDRPVFYGRYLLYTGSYSGVDNIYAIDMSNSEVRKVTSARFGAYDPCPDTTNGQLIYSDYSADGYRLARIPLNKTYWIPLTYEEKDGKSYKLAEQLAKQEGFIYDKKEVPMEEYDSKRYRKGFNLFNFHSWAPLSVNADNFDAAPGIMILSQNLLSTSYTSLGYSFDLNEQTGKYYLSYRYEGFYPLLRLDMDYGLRRSIHIDQDQEEIPLKWHELNLSASAGVPLRWTHNTWSLGIQPLVGSTYKFLRMDPSVPLNFVHDRITSMDYSFYAYSRYKSSLRDLYPPFAQAIELGFRNTPFVDGGNSIFSVEGLLYFPGMIKHHGVRIYTGYQKKNVDFYRFSDNITYARGYSDLFLDEAVTLSLTYAFPFLYPDWQAGPVVYVKRLKAAVFYDHTLDLPLEIFDPANYISAGLDVSVDLHVFSFLAPFELGLRSMYLSGKKRMEFQFLFNIDFDSL